MATAAQLTAELQAAGVPTHRPAIRLLVERTAAEINARRYTVEPFRSFIPGEPTDWWQVRVWGPGRCTVGEGLGGCRYLDRGTAIAVGECWVRHGIAPADQTDADRAKGVGA